MSNSELKSIKRWIREIKALKYQYKPKDTDDPRDWPKIKLPYNVIGCGHQRIVFDMKNDYVLKVAITLDGIKHNQLEARLYRTAPASLKKHLAKVLVEGYGWIIMKKIIHEVLDTKNNRNKLLQLQSKFGKHGIEPIDLFGKKNKINWRNMRLNNKDRLIVIDYGAFRNK